MNTAVTSLGKEKIKFVLLEGLNLSSVESLKNAGYTNVDYLKTALAEDELIERVKDAHFVGIRSRTQLTRRVFENCPKLIAVGCYCIGTNQVDLSAAQEYGVAMAMHFAGTPVSFMANVHCAAATLECPMTVKSRLRPTVSESVKFVTSSNFGFTYSIIPF